ncbi:HAD-IG family 5'-nucleotidase [Myxococcota bacterium]|nr:HAD-IG family 5'-nucleotidase [Myxococcota bacterium]
MTFEQALETPPRARGIFCNRTLNLRTIKAIGYDMDYTLIHYHVDHWERRAYAHLKKRLLARGWPVGDLEFDPSFVMRGLIIDTKLGNIVKANRFGYVKRGCHGTEMLDFDEQRRTYSRELVDLADRRWMFLNTSFAMSEGCMYAQLVDLLDKRQIPEVIGYDGLYAVVRSTLDEAHMEGQLKAEIMASPEQFVDLDRETALALLDQKSAGKKLLLITNSDWEYTRVMMSYAFDRFLPAPMTWRTLFDVTIVSANKPRFFEREAPAFEIVNEEGLCKPLVGGKIREGGIYLGGHAGAVEAHLGLAGEEILFVGDHVFADVNVSKSLLRWRTALVARELEEEFEAVESFKVEQQQLEQLMATKERLEHQLSVIKLEGLRAQHGMGDPAAPPSDELRVRAETLRNQLVELDGRIAPLAKQSSELLNARWGLFMRTGNDKSHLAKQVERYADIYTSRVANFLHHTPFVYLRSPRGTLPHDMDV